MPSLSCDQNLEKKDIYCHQLLGVSPASGTIHVKIGSGRRKADGIDSQLLIWFRSLVSSWGDLLQKAELKRVLQLGQFAHMGYFS